MGDTNAASKPQAQNEAADVYEIKGGELKRAMKLIEYKFAYYLAIFFSALNGAAPIILNIFIGDMVTSLVGDGHNAPKYDQSMSQKEFVKIMKNYVSDTIIDIALKMVYLVIALSLIQAGSSYTKAVVGPRYETSLKKMLFKSIIKQDVAFFDRTASGILIARLSEDIALIRGTYIDKLLGIVSNLIQALACLVLAFVYSWKVTLVGIAFVPVVGGVYFFATKMVGKAFVRFIDTSSKAAAQAEEVITSFRTVKAFDNEIYESKRYVKSLKGVHVVAKSTSVASGIQNGVSLGLTWGMVDVLAYYASYLVIHGDLESGDLIVLFTSLMFVAVGFAGAAGQMTDFKKAQVSAGKIFLIIDEKPLIDRHEGKEMTEVEGKIEFDNVSFKYASSEENAINHLSFTINPGETVALVGESGCGKTTTLSLLQRFYEINEGTIKIDGVDIRDYSQHSLRSHIAVVPQSPVLFSMSIRDNIRFANPSEDPEKVCEAARIGNAHDFIVDLPDNYDTIIQQTNLSGGQKQRICIARAILANTPILLLDEATAALDAESEMLVQQSLEYFRNGKTVIVVAHRLSTVQNADRIFVFQNGTIVESGKHEELIEQSGIYADLVKYQLQ